MTAFSVLEQAPIRAGEAPGQALRDSIAFARHVESLGYARFWIAEHHALGALASAAPEILIGHVAVATSRIRVGSGGMLLPNHSPLHVAEQFRTLEALHPGRIDLGVGRSEGAIDEATVLALRRPQDNGHGAGFDEQLDELLAFGGARPLPDGHALGAVRASPPDVALPPVFLLGSSARSAATAAARGLGYGFAAYSNPDVAAPALRDYRERFTPARPGDRPHAILGLKVIVGADDEHARRLALPWHLSMVQSRTGNRGPLKSFEEASGHGWTAEEREAEQRVDVRADVIGGVEHVRARIAELLAATLADEVIVSTNTHDPRERLASYERLADAIGLGRRTVTRSGDGAGARPRVHRLAAECGSASGVA